MDNMDDFDDDIRHYKKHKMTKYDNSFGYRIEKNTTIKNIKLKIKYKDCDEKFIFNNLHLNIKIEGAGILMKIRLSTNNFIASLLGIKNSIYLIPIIQKNQNSYISSKNYDIYIRLLNYSSFTSLKYVDEVYIEYEKLKDNSSKKTKLNFLINPSPLIYYRNSNIGGNYIFDIDINLNFAILTNEFSFKEEEQQRLEFNEMILNVIYYDTEILNEKGRIKKIEQKKIKINYDDLIIKQFLGNIFYIIPFDEKIINVKNIAYNYHKKNKDKKIAYTIKEVHFVPDIKINKQFYFIIF